MISLQPDPGASKRCEKLEDGFLWSGQCLELVRGNDYSHGAAMSGNRLRAFRLRKFDNMAELILRVLKRPNFHAAMWPHKSSQSSQIWLFEHLHRFVREIHERPRKQAYEEHADDTGVN